MKIKNFFAWFQTKEKLDKGMHKPPLVSVRDIWWASLGENIGSEINGKSNKFTRPVIILKKLSHGFYLVAPSTSQEQVGSWYVPIVHNNKNMFICLHQIRTIDYRRLYSKLGQLDNYDFKRVKDSFWNLYK